MSFYSEHRVKWDNQNLQGQTVVDRLAELTGENPEIVHDMALSGEPAKWYDAAVHLTQISKEHPETVFTLECLGEDRSQSVSFFKDGMHQFVQVERAEFNPETFGELARPGPSLPTSRA